MAKRTVIDGAGTSAIVVANRILFSVGSGDFKGGTKPTLTVVGLSGTETCTITRSTGEIVRNGVIDNTNEGSVTLESAGVYGFFKDITAADVELEVENSV